LYVVNKIDTRNPSNLIGITKEDPEAILSYMYELAVQYIDEWNRSQPGPTIHSQSQLMRMSNSIYRAILVNNVPEYILKIAQRKANTSTRPWLILKAITNMSEMRQWWYDYVDKWALQWIFAPPKDPKIERSNFHTQLTLNYGKMRDVRIVPSKGVHT
jgi:hypothetical protein